MFGIQKLDEPGGFTGKITGLTNQDALERYGFSLRSVKPHTYIYTPSRGAHIMKDFDFEHVQVPAHDPISGQFAVVDEGMRDILIRMWELGLKTQYSCQGNHKTAYVVLNQKSARYFEKLLRTADLSYESRRVADRFLKGPRTHDLCLTTRSHDVFRLVRKGRNRRGNYVVERLYQNAPHWLRTTYRWPIKQSPKVLLLLEELTQT